jgi:riboflavin kinase, archaea type
MQGILISGTGTGAKYMKLYEEIFEEKLGFVPFIGTLNLELKSPPKLEKGKVILVEKEGFGAVDCYKAIVVGGQECVVIVPHLTKLPKNVVEIIAPVNLRKTYELQNGDEIECVLV